jgi:hypothetical protein
MLRPPIQINSLERWAEFGLSPRLRLVLRTLVVLVTNAVLCLGVISSIQVVNLISTHFISRGAARYVGNWAFTFLTHATPTLDGLIGLIYAISAITTTFRVLFRTSD